ncbi:MAG: bifunctional methylenetetrahydrofolate dehydrogenase/methenyltetrahydrofolate cyclohydrolase, partial [Eubacteriales bacterium]|nr:bifunctional methylenetetrahydrofolate dehydrogenase/methenyltetrahydrofolate cyclohydrolase [Eubacteriales bacterium]
SPCLAVVILGNDPASHIYVKNKEMACEYVGIKLKKYELLEDTTEDELLKLIDDLNEDSNVNGILVQLPLPKHINEKNVILKINHIKDIDGFSPYNIGMLSMGSPFFKPCTPFGCIELLKRKDIEIEGKNCLVIGRSNIVGKPLSMLLLNENATVTTAHSKTKNLSELSKNADIIFISIGKAKFLKANMIKENAIIIDIGINRLSDGKICGDCDFDDCYEKASFITPVPKGVGPMTIAMLMKNCLKAYKLQNEI